MFAINLLYAANYEIASQSIHPYSRAATHKFNPMLLFNGETSVICSVFIIFIDS